MADLEQPVVQVLLVRGERRAARAGAAYDGEHAGRRTARSGSTAAAMIGSSAGQQAGLRAAAALGDVGDRELPGQRERATPTSTRPISIEPVSPMNIRAG